MCAYLDEEMLLLFGRPVQILREEIILKTPLIFKKSIHAEK